MTKRSHTVLPRNCAQQTTRCSALDMMVASTYPSLFLCYRERLDTERLQRSLARVLEDFSAFAGRLRREGSGMVIDHTRGGALFEVSETGLSTAALGEQMRSAHSSLVCPQVRARGVLRGKQPLFAARLTHTADGSVLGVLWNHVVGDHATMMMLVRAWASAYREESYEPPIRIEDRNAFLKEHLPPAPNAGKSWEPLSWPKLVWKFSQVLIATQPARRMVCAFSDEDVDAIHVATRRTQSITRHDALTAHLCLVLQRLAPTRISTSFSMAVDLRRRVGIPPNAVGNMSDTVWIRAGASDDTASVAVRFRGAVRASGSGSTLHQDLEALHSLYPKRSLRFGFWSEQFESSRTNVIVSNVTAMKHFDLIFDAAPIAVHARPTDMPASGLVTVMPGPLGQGVIVEALLPSRVAKRVAGADMRTPLPGLAGPSNPLRDSSRSNCRRRLPEKDSARAIATTE